MAIQVGLGAGPQPLAASGAVTDLHNMENRSQITRGVLQNTASSDAQVSIVVSVDNTVLGGEEIWKRTVPAGDSLLITSLIGAGIPADYHVLAVINTAGIGSGEVIADLTYTLFTGDS